MELFDFYRGKRVLVTGHTGFKGAWLTRILTLAGAKVTGYSLEPPTKPSMFAALGLEKSVNHICGDIRDLKHLKEVFDKEQPELVFHLAAQPIVRDSYKDPVYTYETNVMGTVNLLECVRLSGCVRSVVNVTTDKVYENLEWEYGYRENDRLDGYDPYSNSKSCSELVTGSYKRSFFADGPAVSACRAGNVIGGGDFANDRIIPDCVRAAERGEKIIVRNPYSVRPYQHVLEPLFLYLAAAKCQWEDRAFAGSYNVGPEDEDCINTGRLTTLFCEQWGRGLSWEDRSDAGPHEAGFLKLDCSRVKKIFHWQACWHVERAVEQTVLWYQAYLAGQDVMAVTDRQIQEFKDQWHKNSEV